MGFNTILDIIGSIFLAGSLMMVVINLQGDISSMTYTYGNDLIVQTNMTTVTRMLESDFRKIGYWSKVDSSFDPTTAIRSAGQHNITFIADVDTFSNIIDTVKYYVGTKSDLSWTENPNDFPIYRQVNNGTPVMLNVGATQFDLNYYATGVNTAPPLFTFPITCDNTGHCSDGAGNSGIFLIQITLMLQSPAAFDSNYTYAYWRQLRLESNNLKNR